MNTHTHTHIYERGEGAYCEDIIMGKWEGLFMKVFIRNSDNRKQDDDSKL